MNKLNSINGGYKGGSPRVRSENSKKPFADTTLKIINAQELADSITQWYESGRIHIEGIQIITEQLQLLCNGKRIEYDESISSLNDKKNILDKEIQLRNDELSELAKKEDLADMVETIETFFGKDKIESIRNLLKK
jgi:uncharacterized protein YlzI (FlbEa/FlbD family)